MNKLKDYFNIMARLSTVDRYSQSHLSRNESVLEHTGFVCLLAYLIGSKIEDVDIGRLMARAVSHDVDEIITGDLPHVTKYYSESLRKEIHDLEQTNMSRICSTIDNGNLYYFWNNAKDDTLEGFIIKICDLAAVLYKIDQECRIFGNNSILDHCIELEERIVTLMKNDYFKKHHELDAVLNQMLEQEQILLAEYSEWVLTKS